MQCTSGYCGGLSAYGPYGTSAPEVTVDASSFEGLDTAIVLSLYTSLEVTDSTFTDNGDAINTSTAGLYSTYASAQITSSGNTFESPSCSGYCAGVDLDRNVTFDSTNDTFEDLTDIGLQVDAGASASLTGATFTNINASSAIRGSSYSSTANLSVSSSSFSGSSSYDSCWYVSSGYVCDTWGSSASFSCNSSGCN